MPCRVLHVRVPPSSSSFWVMFFFVRCRNDPRFPSRTDVAVLLGFCSIAEYFDVSLEVTVTVTVLRPFLVDVFSFWTFAV